MEHKSKKNRNKGEGNNIKIKTGRKTNAVRRCGEIAVRWGEKEVRHVSQESPITSKAQRHDTAVPIPTKRQAPAGVYDNK